MAFGKYFFRFLRVINKSFEPPMAAQLVVSLGLRKHEKVFIWTYLIFDLHY